METRNTKIEAVLAKLERVLHDEKKEADAQIKHICALLDLPNWVESLGVEKFLIQELDTYGQKRKFCTDFLQTLNAFKKNPFTNE